MGTQKCTTSPARVQTVRVWQPLLRRLVGSVLLLSLVVPVLSHATAVDLCNPQKPVLGYDSGGDGTDGSGDGGDSSGGDGGGEG